MRRNRRDARGVALLVVLMLIAGLLVVGQMAMVLLDSVTQRSGTFHRLEQGQYCAEEGLNLGRAWVMQNAALTGSINPVILSGVPLGKGLFADPANPVDFTAAQGKDLCTISSTAPVAIGGQPVLGLGGICRLIPDPTVTSTPYASNSNWCGSGAGKCAMYRITLVDDMDETPPAQIDPYTDENQAFFIRAECMAEDVNRNTTNQSSAVTALTIANVGTQPMDQVAFVEVNEAGGSTGYGGNSSSNHAGAGGGG